MKQEMCWKAPSTEHPQESTVPSSSFSFSSSSSSSSSCRLMPVALGPLEASSTLATSPFSSPLPPTPTRLRRARRVLYPASRSRRPPLREAPDQALRWLLLLSALVFLQIYTEETLTCTELQSQCPDPTVYHPEDADGSLGCTGEEPWILLTVSGAPEPHMECVVA